MKQLSSCYNFFDFIEWVGGYKSISEPNLSAVGQVHDTIPGGRVDSRKKDNSASSDPISWSLG